MAQIMQTVLEPPTQTAEMPTQTEAPSPREAPQRAEKVLSVPMPDMSHIITEDDEPVDNLFSDKQQHLLVEPLYSGWHSGQPFLANANVGVFPALHGSPLVPDMFLSLGVETPREDIWKKENRSYFFWIYGKPPDAVVEVVSNREGGEGDHKVNAYARMAYPTTSSTIPSEPSSPSHWLSMNWWLGAM